MGLMAIRKGCRVTARMAISDSETETVLRIRGD